MSSFYEKFIVTVFLDKKNNSEHYAQTREKWVVFKTFLGFSFLDIFKNVQFSKPN